MTIKARFRLSLGDFELDVDLEAPGEGVTAIFGPSGSGKTTFLRAVAGLEPSLQGTLEVRGAIWQDSEYSLPAHQRPLGYVFQESSLFSHLSVKRNLLFGFKRIPGKERLITLEQTVDLLGLESLLERSPAGLSGGERQRVAIGRALLTSPRLLLMDEPLTALDVASKREILPFLERLHEELDLPMFYVSHSFDEVARLADHLVLMEAGRVLGSGPIQEMLTRLDLPLARDENAEAVIAATVKGRDDVFQLTELEFPGGTFQVAALDLPPGKEVRLRILARDVSLTLERQTRTSILNIIPARIQALATPSPAQTLVRLDAGGVPLLSRITAKSAQLLKLKPGRNVFAQVKSVAVLS